MEYDGSQVGMWETSVVIMVNGLTQRFTFHPGYPGGAARTLPQFGNQNMGYTPATGVYHKFMLTFRKSNTHTFRIVSPGGQQWQRFFPRVGLYSSSVDGYVVKTGEGGVIMHSGNVESYYKYGLHRMQLLDIERQPCESRVSELFDRTTRPLSYEIIAIISSCAAALVAVSMVFAMCFSCSRSHGADNGYTTLLQ